MTTVEFNGAAMTLRLGSSYVLIFNIFINQACLVVSHKKKV